MPAKPLPPTGEVLLYATEDVRSRVECRFAGETVWLTQALMSALFQKDARTINEHLQNLSEEEELDPGATIRKFRIVRLEGEREVTRLIEFNERRVLPNAGKVSKDQADGQAAAEYEQFAARRRAFAEAGVEREALKSLETAAKQLPTKPEAGAP